jgi:HD-like signal output (HDOD) protein
MAKAFHSAIQAQNMIKQISGKPNEEVFVAGLLFNLGEMAFWSAGGSEAEELDERLAEEGDNTDKLEEEIIGTSFRRISYGLVEEWGGWGRY